MLASCLMRGRAPGAAAARPRRQHQQHAARRPCSRRQQQRLVCVASGAGAPAAAAPASAPSEAITLSDAARAHLMKLLAERAAAAGGKEQQLVFRVGVKQGGCSGMSYVMDFEAPEKLTSEDYVMEYEGGAFKLACDPKSLLYLFGMKLDYSDALIGGGFTFQNPNAVDSCGCGKSFGV